MKSRIRNRRATATLGALLLTVLSACSEETAPDLLSQAEVAVAAGDFLTAERYLQAATRLQPGNGFAQWRMARLMLRMEKGAEAELSIRSAAELGVGAERVKPALAHAYYLQRKWQALRALGIDDTDRGSTASVMSYQALGAIETGDLERAGKLIGDARSASAYSTDMIYASAYLAMARSENHTAVDHMRRVTELEPDYLYASSMLGELALRIGNPLEAEKHFTRAMKRRYDATDDQFNRAVARFQQGEYELAAADTDALSQRDPSNLDYLMLGFRSRVASGDAAQARKFLKASYDAVTNDGAKGARVRSAYAAEPAVMETGQRLIENPNQAASFGMLHAQLLLSQGGSPDEAKRTLEEALSYNPSDVWAVKMLAGLTDPLEDETIVTDRVEAAIKEQPDNIELHMTRADVAEQTHDWSTMVDHLRRVLSLDPGHQQALMRLANHHLVVDRDPARAAELLKAVDAREDMTALATLAEANYLLNLTDEADTAFRMLAEARPDDVHAWFRLAELQNLWGADKDARLALQRIVNTAPDSALAQLANIRLHAMAGRQQEAEQMLAQVTLPDEEPEMLRTRMIVALRGARHTEAERLGARLSANEGSLSIPLRLARGLRRLGQFERAVGVLQTWLENHDDHPVALIELSGLYAATGQAEEKIDSLKKLLALRPNSVFALNNLAWSLRQRDPAHAMALARQAIELAPESEQVLDTLIAILVDNSQSDEALARLSPADEQTDMPSVRLLQRAEVLVRTGRFEDALADLKAVDLDAIPRDKRERRQQLIYAMVD